MLARNELSKCICVHARHYNGVSCRFAEMATCAKLV